MHAHFKPTTLSLSISLALATICMGGARAADDEKGDKVKLQTVTVNAEKEKGFKTKYVQVGAFRDQNVLDVPLTISVIPRVLLEAQDAQGLFDALKNSAGVTRSQTSGTINDTLAIRGISVDARTNYRMNGSLPIINLIDLPLENKERVEALKGSSALYYGFSTPAGIVNMVTKRATATPVTSLAVNANEFGQLVGAVDIGRKFGDEGQFGIRFNGAGGKLRNATDGFKGDRTFASVALDWRVNDDLSLRLDYEDIVKNAIENANVALLRATNNVIPLPAIPDQTKLISGTWAHYDANAQNALVRADYKLGDAWAVTVEAGQADTARTNRNFSQMQNYNLVTGEGTLRTLLTRNQVYQNKNMRVELTGRVDGFLDHEITFGMMRNQRYQNGGGAQTVDVPQNMFNPRVLPAPQLTQVLSQNPQQIDDKGIYLFDRIRLSAEWQVLAGARSSDYSNITRTNTYAVKKVSPSLGMVYRVRPDTSIYATYIEGIEETGTAPATAANAFQALAPAVSKTKELGVRTEAFAGMMASAAFFTIERASAYTNAGNFFVLDGRAHYQGLELALNGALTPTLSMYFSGLLLDVEQRKAANAALIGKITENTAKQSGSLFAEYKPGYLPGVSLNAGAFYTGKRAVNNLNQAFIPGVTIFTAGARYATKIGGYPSSFQVNVENLGDKRFWAATGAGFVAAGMPRTVKVSAKFDF